MGTPRAARSVESLGQTLAGKSGPRPRAQAGQLFQGPAEGAPRHPPATRQGEHSCCSLPPEPLAFLHFNPLP